LARFRARLRELGYVEGKSILIEERYAEGNAQRLKGLAQELAASNVTGTTNLPLGGKHIELIRELVPCIAKLAIRVNPTDAGTPAALADVNVAARSFNIGVLMVEVTRADDFEMAFAVLRSERPDALLVMVEPLIFVNRARVTDFAAGARLPTTYDIGTMVRAGRIDCVRPGHHRALCCGRRLCRQDIEGRESRRSPNRATD
jgi:hypothetical protein